MNRHLSPRGVATLLAIAALLGCGIWLGQTTSFAPEQISERFRALGYWSVPAFVGGFIAAVLVSLPGSLFVLAAPLLYGKLLGFALAYAGAVLAVTVPFMVARTGRGDSAAAPLPPRWRRLTRLIERVEQNPVRNVFLLRLALFMSPPLNYALAFTRIRARDYVLGSALGVAPAVIVVVSVAGCFPWW